MEDENHKEFGQKWYGMPLIVIGLAAFFAAWFFGVVGLALLFV